MEEHEDVTVRFSFVKKENKTASIIQRTSNPAPADRGYSGDYEAGRDSGNSSDIKGEFINQTVEVVDA